ncbi:hypothetical protein NQF87_00860 [Bombella sp. TMW 2.2559]|uniref:Uncharacterized protein n=1 Tax=Bombella dulcis TaxID=2967339 RepID=A0ABT3W8Y5_9PROT|nr:hypothetical protein [Bombella dulcis]MCX5615535.1 hypothetical protein [Bombella dulcis]
MKHLDLILTLLCLSFWGALYAVYYKDNIIHWLVNRFTRDKFPKKMTIENGYFPDGQPIPFRENLYPSARKKDDEAAETDTPPAGKDTPPSQEKPSHEEGKSGTDHSH